MTQEGPMDKHPEEEFSPEQLKDLDVIKRLLKREQDPRDKKLNEQKREKPN
ncbi:hypothetical protein KW798_03795 [Candidatus Parcubacteria bacterium]|nr:hypothetical protein [Candidatus Parcubacteria bacterium]